MDDGHHVEKRWGVRVPTQHPVTIRWEAADRVGTIRHLSMAGCFIETAFPFPPGAGIALDFILEPGHPQILTEGKIVSRNHGGIGVRFLHRDAATSLEIKRWIDARTPRSS